ncbi:recombination regulator RecX [bacterium]|nr:recombination regulator RecX [bacterium]MBU4510297.1 recombination regulator RecX [bacterium]
MNKITSINYDKKDISQVVIYVDNKAKYKLNENTIKSLDIYVGKELSDQEIEKIISEDKTIRGKEYLLRLLSRRIYSRYEISGKLKNKGYPEKNIAELIIWLEDNNYINDELFAEMWAQFRLQNKPIGRYKLNQELRTKGIKQDIIQKVIDKTYKEMDELSLAHNLIKEKIVASEIKNIRIDPKKIYNFLLRRGFSTEISRNICNELNNKQIKK